MTDLAAAPAEVLDVGALRELLTSLESAVSKKAEPPQSSQPQPRSPSPFDVTTAPLLVRTALDAMGRPPATRDPEPTLLALRCLANGALLCEPLALLEDGRPHRVVEVDLLVRCPLPHAEGLLAPSEPLLARAVMPAPAVIGVDAGCRHREDEGGYPLEQPHHVG